MSAANGQEVIKIGRKGKRKIQYDDDTPVVDVDIVATQNLWAEVDREFRDEKGDVVPEQRQAFYQAMWEFAKGLLQAPEMSLADAMHFLKVITDEAKKLKDFFEPAIDGESSSVGPTEVTYSA